MKSYNSINLYKQNIKQNKVFLIIIFIIFTLGILFMDIINIIMRPNSPDLKLIYENFRYNQMIIYVLAYIIFISKMLNFTNKYLYVLRIGHKKTLWKTIIQHVLITSSIMSAYVVIVSYILARLISKYQYTNLLDTILILFIVMCMINLCMCIFGIASYILNSSINSIGITSVALIVIIVMDTLLPENKSLIFASLSFNAIYIKTKIFALYNILEYGGITILLFELGKYLNNKKELYKTKDRLGVGSQYE